MAMIKDKDGNIIAEIHSKNGEAKPPQKPLKTGVPPAPPKKG